MTHCGKFVGLGYWFAWGMLAQMTIGCGGRASENAAGSGNASGTSSETAGGGVGGAESDAAAGAGGVESDAAAGAATLPPPDGPFPVSRYFSPSLLGDGQTPGKISVDIDGHCKTRPDGARGACYRFVYTVGDDGWGGAQWVLEGSNGGQDPGLAIPAASLHHVSFYAAEDGGSDYVVFGIGGVDGTRAIPPGMFSDTFYVQDSETLTSDWQKFEIDIPPASDFQPPITSLLGAFSWTTNFTFDPMPAPPKTIYIDDLVYE